MTEPVSSIQCQPDVFERGSLGYSGKPVGLTIEPKHAEPSDAAGSR
jgi:hypothetical protein